MRCDVVAHGVLAAVGLSIYAIGAVLLVVVIGRPAYVALRQTSVLQATNDD